MASRVDPGSAEAVPACNRPGMWSGAMVKELRWLVAGVSSGDGTPCCTWNIIDVKLVVCGETLWTCSTTCSVLRRLLANSQLQAAMLLLSATSALWSPAWQERRS